MGRVKYKYEGSPVRIPQRPGILRRENKNFTSIYYQYDSIYNPDKKHSNSKRAVIGRVCTEDPTLMIPNENYRKYLLELTEQKEEAASTDNADVEYTKNEKKQNIKDMKCGGFLAIQETISRLDESWINDLGESMQNSQLTLADFDTAFNACLQNSVKNTRLTEDLASYLILEEQDEKSDFGKYVCTHPLFSESLDTCMKTQVVLFLSSFNEDTKKEFLTRWNSSDRRNSYKTPYLVYSYEYEKFRPGEINLVEKESQVNLSDVKNVFVAKDAQTGRPMFYEEYPDVTGGLSFIIDAAFKYGCRDVCFVHNRGNFTRKDIQRIDDSSTSFIIAGKANRNFLRKTVLSKIGKFEYNYTYRAGEGIYGRNFRLDLFGDGKRHPLYIYYSSGRCLAERLLMEQAIERERRLLENQLARREKTERLHLKYFSADYGDDGILTGFKERENFIREELKLCGYFCIVDSRKPPKDWTPEDELKLYKNTEYSEKFFFEKKDFYGRYDLSAITPSAKLFIRFIALIIYNRMESILQRKGCNQSVSNAIYELEKIRMTEDSHTFTSYTPYIARNGSNIFDSPEYRSFSEQKKWLDVFGIGKEKAIGIADVILEGLK